MRTIWKYAMVPGPLFKMPTGATIVHAALQRDIPTVWVDCDPENPPELRRFEMYPTGVLVPAGAKHQATFLLEDGNFVLHLYELST